MENTEIILKRYQNNKDYDIQDFLNNKAITYENRKWCTTYLIVDELILSKRKEVVVEGYFTLSNKIVEISDKVSNTLKRKLFHGIKKSDANLHVILIGQLGKYSGDDRVSDIHLSDILDYAFSVVNEVDRRIACSCILLEYETTRTGLRKKYDMYEFKELQTIGTLTQLFHIL